MTLQEAFVDSVDQDQTALNVQSDLDLHCPHVHSRYITFSSSCNGSVFLANEKLRFIYSVVKQLTLYHILTTFDTRKEKKKLFENIVEREKMLITSIFSFSPQCLSTYER